MAVGEVMRMEIPAGGDLTVTTPELHVLAVDDSIVDRKVIERLLRISSCKGKNSKPIFFCSAFVGFNSPLFFFINKNSPLFF